MYKKIKNKKSIFVIFLGLVLILFSLVLLLFNKKTFTRTMMFYISSSSVENSDYLPKLFNESNKNIDFDNINILFVTDFYEEIDNIYTITNNGIQKVNDNTIDKINHEKRISEFLNYSYNNYKTDYYDFFFYDIDNGKIQSEKKENISFNNLENGLKNSLFNENNKLELINLGLSYGNNYDFIQALSNYSTYLSAYDSIFTIEKNNDYIIGDFLSDISKYDEINDIYKKINDRDKNVNASFSLYNLDKAKEINNLFSDYIKQLSKKIDTNYDDILKIRSLAQSSSEYDLINLYKFIENSKETFNISTEIISLFTEMIYSNNNSNSILLYFPYNTLFDLENYKTISRNDDYVSFLNILEQKKSEENDYEIELDENIIKIDKNADDKYSLNVKFENSIDKKISSLSYILFINENDYLIPVKYFKEIPIINNELNLDFDLSIYKAVDIEKNENFYLPIIIDESTNNSNITLPVTFMSHNSNISSKYIMYNSDIIIDDNNDDKLTYSSSFNTIDKKNSDIVSSKVIIDGKNNNFEKLLIKNESYKLNSNNYDLIYSGNRNYKEYETDKIEFKKESECNNCKYYIVLRIKDIFNNELYSQLKLVN